MTEKDKLEIINELEKRLEEKYKQMFMKEHNGAILREPREKWFNSPDSRSGQCARNSIMTNAFGHPFYLWQVWENIRKLTCQICGKRYVRELAEDKAASAVCEKLCQVIFELREGHEGRDIDA